MQSTSSALLTQIASSIAVQSPLLLVCLVGLVVVLFKWRRHPTACMFAGAGLALRLFVGVGAPVVSGLLSHVFREQLGSQISTAFTVAAVVWSILGGVSMVLLIAAVFVGRTSPAPAAVAFPVPPRPAA